MMRLNPALVSMYGFEHDAPWWSLPVDYRSTHGSWHASRRDDRSGVYTSGKDEADLRARMLEADRSNPLPHPGFRVGQVWLRNTPEAEIRTAPDSTILSPLSQIVTIVAADWDGSLFHPFYFCGGEFCGGEGGGIQRLDVESQPHWRDVLHGSAAFNFTILLSDPKPGMAPWSRCAP